MTQQEFNPPVNTSNPEPRIACALLLDCSSSMAGEPIEALNQGFSSFCEEIKNDVLARKRTEIAVVAFGGNARIEIPFTAARDLQPRTLSAAGGTPMGAALDLGLGLLNDRKAAFRQAGLEAASKPTARGCS